MVKIHQQPLWDLPLFSVVTQVFVFPFGIVLPFLLKALFMKTTSFVNANKLFVFCPPNHNYNYTCNTRIQNNSYYARNKTCKENLGL
jgi:hypothetical protein